MAPEGRHVEMSSPPLLSRASELLVAIVGKDLAESTITRVSSHLTRTASGGACRPGNELDVPPIPPSKVAVVSGRSWQRSS